MADPWSEFKPATKGGDAWSEFTAVTPQSRARADAERRIKSNPDQLRAFTKGATFGFADELDALSAGAETAVNNLARKVTGRPSVGYGAKDAYDAVMTANRLHDDKFAQNHPVQNATLQIAGGLAAPGGGAAAKFIGKAQSATQAALRAGVVGAASGAAMGAGEGEGVGDRVRKAAAGAGVGAVTGAGLSRVGSAVASSARRAKFAAPSAARQLSQQGVELTPGQMMGGSMQRIEDGATSIPFVGDAIRSRRVEGIGSFNRVVLNRALGEIGLELPKGVNVGRDGIRMAQNAISGAYKQVLEPLEVAVEPSFAARVAQIKDGAKLTPAQLDEFDSIIANTVGGGQGRLTGEEWKRIDTDLGSNIASAMAGSSNSPSSGYLGRVLAKVQGEWRDMLARQAPDAAEAVSKVNAANAHMVRARQAAQMKGARDGVFTPAQFNSAVHAQDNTAGNRAYAAGEALMQDLSDNALNVLPASVPDSGTPFRSAVNALVLSGGGLTLGVEPSKLATVATGLAAGAGLYSKPVQAILNQAYRSWSPGSARAAAAELQKLASQSPGLQAEVAKALGDLSGLAQAPTGVSQDQGTTIR